ncbi:MAG: diaminopimelate decarboxylase [Alphaproteobacteria bacterium]
MSAFAYKNAKLHVENLSLESLAAKHGTPLYVYSWQAMADTYNALANAVSDFDATIVYAIKANSALGVVDSFRQLGAGADVVSIGEMKIALAVGVDPKKIVFAGVAKQRHELVFALQNNILQINVESYPELLMLEQVASEMGVVAPVALRVNPNVDAKTHAKITTGKAENKFGVEFPQAIEMAAYCRNSNSLSLDALAMHIGSQLMDLSPFREAYQKLASLSQQIGGLKRLDLGGGLGIKYKDEVVIDPQDYAAVLKDEIKPLGLPILLEPGRSLIGNCGVLLSKTVYVKEGSTRKFLILDAGMNDLMRPSMYDAYHNILPLNAPVSDELEPYDVVGPICESGDTFGKGRMLPSMQAGDLVAFESAGAYSAVMASTYNARPTPTQVLVKGDEAVVLTERDTIENMIERETIPAW